MGKTLCSRLATANQDGQKNNNGKTTAVLLYVLSTSASTV